MMDEKEKCFVPVEDAPVEDVAADDVVTFRIGEALDTKERAMRIGEVLDIKGRTVRITRITKHSIVLTPLGWEPDIGESIATRKNRERQRRVRR